MLYWVKLFKNCTYYCIILPYILLCILTRYSFHKLSLCQAKVSLLFGGQNEPSFLSQQIIFHLIIQTHCSEAKSMDTAGPKSHLNHPNLLPHWSLIRIFVRSLLFSKAELFLLKAERFFYWKQNIFSFEPVLWQQDTWFQGMDACKITVLYLGQAFHSMKRNGPECGRGHPQVQSCSPSHNVRIVTPHF